MAWARKDGAWAGAAAINKDEEAQVWGGRSGVWFWKGSV